jgi:hypothetical protein
MNEQPSQIVSFGYRRIDHFILILSLFQVNTPINIPQEVYDVILCEKEKEDTNNTMMLTRNRVRKYLRKYQHLGYDQYYDHIYQILCHLDGLKPLSISPDVNKDLCDMFVKIQEPFKTHRGPHREFLPYTYVIYKFYQILGFDECLPYCDRLRPKTKCDYLDAIWEKICLDLGWTYYPSIIET